MANIKSQIKRNRQNEVRRVRNKATRSELQTYTKTALAAADSGEGYDAELREAVKRIDKAVSKGVLHKNAGARRKSRLIKQLRRVAADS